MPRQRKMLPRPALGRSVVFLKSSSMPVKFRVRIARTAERDIEEIWGFIAADSPAEADKFIRRIENHIGTLERFPERCPLIAENELRRYSLLPFAPGPLSNDLPCNGENRFCHAGDPWRQAAGCADVRGIAATVVIDMTLLSQ